MSQMRSGQLRLVLGFFLIPPIHTSRYHLLVHLVTHTFIQQIFKEHQVPATVAETEATTVNKGHTVTRGDISSIGPTQAKWHVSNLNHTANMRKSSATFTSISRLN